MRRANLLIVIGTLAALAVAAVPASAVPQVQRARFRVTLSGQQTSSWTLNRSSTCGSFTGSGDQSFSYHQSRAVTLLFTRYVHHDGMPWVEIPGSTSGIPVTGTASQHGTLVADTTNPNCVGRPIGPPQAPPASDCGTKHYAGSFDVRWYRPQDYPAAPTEPVPLDTAFFLDEEQPQLPFFHCPFNGPLIM